MRRQLAQLLTVMEEKGLESFFVSKPVNVRYISGYTGDDSYLLITPNEYFFITDPRYTEQVSYECPDYTIVNWREFRTLDKCVAALAENNHLKNVAFESSVLNVNQYLGFQSEVKSELIPTDDIIEEFRSVKTPEEIAYLRASCEIASRAFERIIQDIRVGITEKELAARLSLYMVMEGADTQPYGNILISGARTSLLHGIPSSKAVEYGDLVLFDYGCQYHGYLSDMTRTVVVGKATPKQKEVYQLEWDMVEAMEKELKPGATSRSVYEAGAKLLKGTEYEPYHYTGVGHGIGMFVHEIPFMGPNHPYVIRENQVLTIEPGIYIPGWGGIRIEDQLLVTADGCENLISARKELIEL